jgi:hypothetical protein
MRKHHNKKLSKKIALAWQLPTQLSLFAVVEIQTSFKDPLIIFLHNAFLIRAGELSEVRIALWSKARVPVIIKLVEKSFNERFDRIMSCFRHELICLHVQNRLLGVGHLVGFYFLITPFIAGRNLHLALSQDYLTAAEKLKLAIRIGMKLLALEKAGIYHNDLSDEHILINARGKPFIIDFNLAVIKNFSRFMMIHRSNFYYPKAYLPFSPEFLWAEPNQCHPRTRNYRGVASDQAYAFGYILSKIFIPNGSDRLALLMLLFEAGGAHDHGHLTYQVTRLIACLIHPKPWFRINLSHAVGWLIQTSHKFNEPWSMRHMPAMSLQDKFKVSVETHPKFINGMGRWPKDKKADDEILKIEPIFSILSAPNAHYRVVKRELEYDMSEFFSHVPPLSVVNTYEINCSCIGTITFFRPLQVSNPRQILNQLLTHSPFAEELLSKQGLLIINP